VTGFVDEDVDPPVAVERRSYESLEVGRIRDVSPDTNSTQ